MDKADLSYKLYQQLGSVPNQERIKQGAVKTAPILFFNAGIKLNRIL